MIVGATRAFLLIFNGLNVNLEPNADLEQYGLEEPRSISCWITIRYVRLFSILRKTLVSIRYQTPTTELFRVWPSWWKIDVMVIAS